MGDGAAARTVALSSACRRICVEAGQGYDWLEVHADFGAPLHIGHIALATTLDWLAFRELPSFTQAHSRLSAWFEAFASRHSMLSTPLHGDTLDQPASA